MKKLFDTNPESLIFAALIKVVQRIAIGVRVLVRLIFHFHVTNSLIV